MKLRSPPATFPEVSPLVQFLTTAGGTFRFNANLYADGKVCLSLLGTWHGTDKTEKWQPGTSTVAQVLLSIATQILCAEPYFNEPGYADARGTPHGRAASQAYDDELRVGTVRYAMIAPIRAPPKGLEAACRAHFRLQRKRLLAQVSAWARGAASAKHRAALRRLLGELRDALDSLGGAGGEGTERPAKVPRTADAAA